MTRQFRFISLAVMLLASVFAFSQTDVGAQGGVLIKAPTLFIPNSQIGVFTDESTNTTTTGDLGSVSVIMPALASGTLNAGGTFEAGGVLSINAPGFVSVTGTLVAGGTWQKGVNANGTVFYIASASFTTSTGGTGAFVFSTNTLGSTGFKTVAAINSFNIHLN